MQNTANLTFFRLFYFTFPFDVFQTGLKFELYNFNQTNEIDLFFETFHVS